MVTRVINKVLAGREDFLLGNGVEAQTRGSESVNITKINIPFVVQSVAEINALDPLKFQHVILNRNGVPLPVRYDAAAVVVANNIDSFNSSTGVGRWLADVDLKDAPIVQGDAPLILAAAITLTRKTIIKYDNKTYRYIGALPYVTTGNALTDGLSPLNADRWVRYYQGDKFNSVAPFGYTSIRSNDWTGHQYVQVPWGFAYGDKAGGDFYVDTTDVATADNNGTVLVDSVGNRLKRVFSGKFNVLWFGADSTGLTATHAQIQATVNVAQAKAGCVFFPEGEYLTTDSIIVTSTCTMTAEARAPTRLYPGILAGGAWINFQKVIGAGLITDKASFALQIDTGSPSFEGYAEVVVSNLGFICKDPKAGSIYGEGAVGIDIRDNWFANDYSNYLADTTTGISILWNTVIISKIQNNSFFGVGWGIVFIKKCNENVISGNAFQAGIQGFIGFFSAAGDDTIRNTIADNNFTGSAIGLNRPGTAIYLAGQVDCTTIARNTFEIIRGSPVISVDNVNVITSAALPSTGRGTVIDDNTFLACGGGVVGSTCVAVNDCVNITLTKNKIVSPTGPMTAFCNIGVGVTDYVLLDSNDVNGKLQTSGNTPMAIIRASKYDQIPKDNTDTSAATFTSDHAGSTWWNNTSKTYKVWNGTESCLIKSGGQISLNSASTTTTTYTVRGASSIQMAPTTGSHTVTNITDGYIGQKCIFYNNSATFSVTFQHNTNLRMKAGANVVLGADQYIVLERITSTRWVEVA